MEALTAKDKSLIVLTQKVDGLTQRFETLFVQSDELTKKQLSLDSLHEQLGQVDELAKKNRPAYGFAQAKPQVSRIAAPGDSRLLQVARRNRQAARQARLDRAALETFDERNEARWPRVRRSSRPRWTPFSARCR